MSRTGTLRAEIARLLKTEADLHNALAKHIGDANKQSADANKKFDAAAKTKSPSTRSSYLRQAESTAKKAADSEKKAAAVRKKLSALVSSKVSKQKSLAASEEADRRKISRDAAKERKAETNHVRQMATMRRSALNIPPPKPEPLRVLYLTTNPEAFNDGALRTDAEVRNVQKELRGSRYRDRVQVSHFPAATFEDMLQGMNDRRPHVIHFSGHGGGSGILFDNGSVDSPAGIGMQYHKLEKFLSATDEPPRLLVLNACGTLDGAETLLDAVPVVIAMSDSITDLAAVTFASAFYSAIASAQSVGTALKQAKAVLSMLPSAEDHLPDFIARDDVDIENLILVIPD